MSWPSPLATTSRCAELPNRLLVEGTDDQYVIRHICGVRSITESFQIVPLEGVDAVFERIPIELKFAQEGDIVGIVVDADEDPKARWDAVRGRLAETGFSDVPARPQAGGTILDAPGSLLLERVGVWIMPDNRNSGKLENLLLSMIPEDDDLFEHATGCIESIANPRFGEKDREKALVHTWLAWQAEPGRPYGTAIAAGFLDHDVPDVDAFAAWLDGLFA